MINSTVKKLIKVLVIVVIILIAGYFLIAYGLGLLFLVYRGNSTPDDCPGVEIKLKDYTCSNGKLSLTIKNTGTVNIYQVSDYLTDRDSGEINNPASGFGGTLKGTDVGLKKGEVVTSTLPLYSKTDKFMILTPIIEDPGSTYSVKICLQNSIRQYFSCTK